MPFTLQTNQKVELDVAFFDAAGNEAATDGEPIWATSDPTILRVTGSNGGLHAVAVAVGPTGPAQIQLSADARFGDEVAEIHGVLDVNVVSAEAVTAVITPGQVTENTDEIPPMPEPVTEPGPDEEPVEEEPVEEEPDVVDPNVNA
jgi:hypothetical protein